MWFQESKRIVTRLLPDGLSCALTGEGVLRCWGEDAAGQSPAVSAGPYLDVGAGAAHTCALDEAHAVRCWGDDSLGQSSPPDARFVDIEVGGWHTCGPQDRLPNLPRQQQCGQSVQPRPHHTLLRLP